MLRRAAAAPNSTAPARSGLVTSATSAGLEAGGYLSGLPPLRDGEEHQLQAIARVERGGAGRAAHVLDEQGARHPRRPAPPGGDAAALAREPRRLPRERGLAGPGAGRQTDDVDAGRAE